MLSFTNERKKNCQDIYCKSVTHIKKKNLLKFLFCSLFTLKNKKCSEKKNSEKIIFCLFHR